MASKKDLVEAYSFSRRRLVTAFVSGAPGGREVEPARPGRSLVGGAALAVLLIAGAAIAGQLSPRAPTDWSKPGIVISKGTGASYLILAESEQPVLRPVLNMTSARLIFGADAKPTVIAQDVIDQQTIGPDIGILGAPATVPGPAQLIEDGWVACTRDKQGIKLTVDLNPTVRSTPSAAYVVSAGGDYYLITEQDASEPELGVPGAFALPLPDEVGQRDAILSNLSLRASAEAATVSPRFLSLFPIGAPLTVDSFGLGEVGKRIDVPGLPRVKVGDLLQRGQELLVLTETGPMTLTPFAGKVYRGLRPGLAPIDAADLSMGLVKRDYAKGHWPSAEVAQTGGDMCAQLVASPSAGPAVRLVGSPAPELSAATVAPGTHDVTVQSGHGAYVLSGQWSSERIGQQVLVDNKGFYYPFRDGDTHVQLGYGDVVAPLVPDSWVEMFEQGTPLSRDLALCPAGATEEECS